MNYPQHGAGYRYEPKWLDEVKRAEGGNVSAPSGQKAHGSEVPGYYEHPLEFAPDVLPPQVIPGQQNTSRKDGDAIDYHSDDIMRSKYGTKRPEWGV